MVPRDGNSHASVDFCKFKFYALLFFRVFSIFMEISPVLALTEIYRRDLFGVPCNSILFV